MVRRFFLDKCTTILENSTDNFGLNPIGVLTYGNGVSRAIIHFDDTEIQNILKDYKTDTKCILKLTNCSSIQKDIFKELLPNYGVSERATSFDIVYFKVPEYWDEGVGFDNSSDFWLIGKNVASSDGANWYQAYNGKSWHTEGVKDNCSNGIYSTDFIDNEIIRYESGCTDTIIIGIQHFDHGNENFEIDITDYIKYLIENKKYDEEYDKYYDKNYGIGICFHPRLEEKYKDIIQYVGFFTNHTNTFFQPCVEVRNNDYIKDDRYSFYSGQKNRLYFVFNGELDELPTCTINDEIYAVSSETRGVYYTECKFSDANKVYYDVWGNLKYNGEILDDVEKSFNVLPNKKIYLSIPNFKPTLSAINDNEKIYRGDIRNVMVRFRVPYSREYENVENVWYRIYVKEGDREIDIIDWDRINRLDDYNYFTIYSSDFIPFVYYVDIKTKIGNEIKIFKDKLHFKIVDNVTNMTK